DDVRDIAHVLARRSDIELNIEGDPRPDLIDLVHEVRPNQCTLVPVLPGEITSQAGWRPGQGTEPLPRLVASLRSAGIRVSLFVDALPEPIKWAASIGADRVELYTEPYAKSFGSVDEAQSLSRYTAAARAAQRAGLGVNAGHDLNRTNLPRFLAVVPGVEEVSIGHALIADALEEGLAQTVRSYLAAIGHPA
ncbi:MAG: pyridoxine 5'-phosphate synthase, partial [Burkholderiales bacterium]